MYAITNKAGTYCCGLLIFARRGMTLNLNFDNLVLRSLPLDEEHGSRVRKVEGACFSLVKPTPCENPKTVALSKRALALLDIKAEDIDEDVIAEYFSGNKILDGSQPAAHCYCGHQFGNFAGQLGDGAAMYLGEVVNSKNERWELQIKGAGPTPYSRQSDGRKVLRSSIREFLCSEAMNGLGIATTRAGTIVTSDSRVIRDILYDGHPINERITIVSRIAPSFLRFGSFEIFKRRDPETLREGPSSARKHWPILDTMLDYTIKNFYTEVWDGSLAAPTDSTARHDMLLRFYEEVLSRTGKLAARWQCVGFCHGVLNTDNMSVLGLTIDYGPYGFMDRFDPEFICNSSDNSGRYSYTRQPEMVRWNCRKFAEALSHSLPLEKSLERLKVFDETFDAEYLSIMRRKFGLASALPDDMKIVSSFLSALALSGCDFTNGFRCLSELALPGSENFKASEEKLLSKLLEQCCTSSELAEIYKPTSDPWISQFKMLLQRQPELWDSGHPFLELVREDQAKQAKYLELKDISEEAKGAKDRVIWSKWIAEFKARLEKEDLSGNLVELNNQRRENMNLTNPRFVLRNHLAQGVIEAAEDGNYLPVRNLLAALEDPYSETEIQAQQVLTQVTASCSSDTHEDGTEPVEITPVWLSSRPPPGVGVAVS